MAKIIAPNNQYTGVSASVPFVHGVGQTEDKRLIEWFKSHGYTVEDEEPTQEPVEEEPVPEEPVQEDELAEEHPDEVEVPEAPKRQRNRN